jgi:acetyl-CoA carboxylase, biotin carboxylase subunit
MVRCRMFEKVLVANRGEIAVRVMGSLREMGIATVAVYSTADRRALHVRVADEAVHIGPAPSNESYLRIDAILDAARETGAQAIHPGYGFLSENADFARACGEAGITFIGPPTHAIEAMGEKTRARSIMQEAGVPLVPGTPSAIEDVEEATRLADEIGFPVLIKASAGGGGKGMRRVDDIDSFSDAFASARREALSAFGNGDVFVEKYVVDPKHVEFQIMADQHGNVVHLFERDCSVQRRHQKVIEETPCPVLSTETRRAMGKVAVDAARAVGYVGAGTIEFIMDSNERFYFLEMNTRLQVEHPVTEMVTGVDLVQLQLEVAAGGALPFAQEDIHQVGASIQCRIYAEDPDANFRPSPGTITMLRPASGPWVRDDTGVYEGAEVSTYYDPMIAKLVVWGEDRSAAIARMKRALDSYVVSGITTNLSFHRVALEHPDFVSGHYTTDFVSSWKSNEGPAESQDDQWAEIAAVLALHLGQGTQAEQSNRMTTEGPAAGNRWKLHGRYRRLGSSRG